jgi:hypothetical protein
MRYTGGLLGGSWLTALTGDLGAGKFDGAWLVQNFENQNPANTLWTKQYNLYSKIDTEAERYLGFERWWGGHVMLNAEEMQFIVDELFVGNKLAAGEIRTSDGTAVDLRNIRSPILIFCSKGDNVTPPQQALDWILDLYDSVDDIRAHGQTIVYCIHDKIGHLGIFVSAGVARKEHDEFASNIDFIDLLPPGLYEAVLEPKGPAIENPELVTGEWLMRCESRTLDDIRALGGNSLEDERRFAAAARLSEINLSLYRALVQPLVKSLVSPGTAEAMRAFHPLRLQYELFGPKNPWTWWIEESADRVREARRPASPDNLFLKMQEQVSKQIVEAFENYRQMAEKFTEETFHAVYGRPTLQAALSVSTDTSQRPRKAAKSLLHKSLVTTRIAELQDQMTRGGVPEGLTRALLYVRAASGTADERGMEAIRRIRLAEPLAKQLTLEEFKSLIRQQYFLLLIDEETALAAIPDLLPRDIDELSALFTKLVEVLESRGRLGEPETERLSRLKSLLGLKTLPEGLGNSAVTSRKAS